MLEISVKRIRSNVGYIVLSSDIFPWQTHLYCPLSVTVRLWNAFNRIYLESPKFPENLIRTWALCPPGQRESSSLSLSFTVSSTFLSFYPSFRTLIASVQLCRTRTIVSPHVLSSPVTCVAFQWLLTSSTDKFSSFRLSIVRFRCLVCKNYQLTIRTRSVFLYFSCFLLGVREKRLQRRVYSTSLIRNIAIREYKGSVFHKSWKFLVPFFINVLKTLRHMLYIIILLCYIVFQSLRS